MRLKSWIISALWFVGMVTVFVGERLIATGTARWTSAVGVLLVLLALGLRAAALRGASTEERRAAERILLGLGALGALSLALYFAQSDLSGAVLAQPLERSSPRLSISLAALWPALWVASALPIVMVEFAYAAVARAPHLEIGRIRDAALSGLGLAGALVFAFTATYVATARDKKVDLSYARTAKAGESTRKIVRTLDKPLTVALFFPPANEVHEQVASYFKDLRAESPLVEIQEYDHAVDLKKAQELGVTGNGIIVIARGARKEPLSVGLNFEGARSHLANLDREVQKRLLQVARPERVAYLTTGHGERTASPEGDTDKRGTIKELRDLLTDQSFQVRNLGPAEGLAADVPNDAAVVIVAGPTKQFLPEEIGALGRYLDRGGRLLVALDPDPRVDFSALLAPLGLRQLATPLANDQAYGRRTFQAADRGNLIVSAFSSHPSVTTLGRLGGRAPLVLPGAGALEELSGKDKPAGAQVSFTVHAHAATWNDADGNFTFDAPAAGKPGETRKPWELAAAVTRPGKAAAKPAEPPKDPSKPPEKADAPEARAVVIADSDILTDGVLAAYGNPAFVVDGVRWLIGEEAIIGEVASEVDAPIAHTRKQDVVWFYSTTFLAPALVLGVGLLGTRRRRRARPQSGDGSGGANKEVTP